LLRSLTPEEKEKLDFIPISDSNNHCSLLIYEVESAMFYHFDNSPGKINRNLAKEIAQEILRCKGLPVDNFQELEITGQSDRIEIIAFAEKMVREYDKTSTLELINFTEWDLTNEKKY